MMISYILNGRDVAKLVRNQ